MLPPKAYAALFGVAVVFSAGFFVAWGWQAGKIDKSNAQTVQVRADFAAYVAEGLRLTNEAAIAAAKQREKADHDWKKTLDRIKNDPDAYARCVAAGRCGPARVCVVLPPIVPGAGGEATAVPAAGQPPSPSPDAIPAPRGFEAAEGLAADCQHTTAQLNALQADIEAQPGYKPVSQFK